MKKKILAVTMLSVALTGCAQESSKSSDITSSEEVQETQASTEASQEVTEEETQADSTEEATTAAPETTKAPEKETTTVGEPAEVTEPHEEMNLGEYQLVWEDNFDEAPKYEDWRYELHKPGWVNAELQEYVQSEENVYVDDGILYIKPIKTVAENGDVSYTSGRINTMGKHDFKYGIFEARIKMPAGKGFLPAFWLMPTEQGKYGNWPKCGEIDIAEVLGDKPLTTYGTIHYGVPHKQNQGKYTLEEGSFTDEFHTYAVEWVPDAINWYIDGQLFYTTSDWYTGNDEEHTVPYPAPFNQKFYIILNLAVGGSWPGDPDDTTDFDAASMQVDYVRVYQKDSYNENVKAPEKVIVFREPDDTGNYINNGDFSVDESLDDEEDWTFLKAEGGVGTAEISDGAIKITTENAGSVDYSIQLVSWKLPAKKGASYQISFDAYASENRTMITGISAPDKGYIRYFGDETVELTTEKQTYTFEYTMNQSDDANARLEFNMGNTGSTADIYISNVRVEEK